MANYEGGNTFTLNSHITITRQSDSFLLVGRSLAHIRQDGKTADQRSTYRVLTEMLPNGTMPQVGDIVTVQDPLDLAGAWIITISPFIAQGMGRNLLHLTVARPNP